MLVAPYSECKMRITRIAVVSMIATPMQYIHDSSIPMSVRTADERTTGCGVGEEWVASQGCGVDGRMGSSLFSEVKDQIARARARLHGTGTKQTPER